MNLAWKLAIGIHVLAGAVALSVFWLPLVTKKGGAAHRRVGWVYVVAAAAIAVTAFLNCGRMLTDASPRNDAPGVFLAYVSVIAWASAQLGVRSLRTKKRTTASRDPIDLAPAALLVVGGVGLAAFAAHERVLVYAIFSALGVTLGAMQLRFWLRPPQTRGDWYLAHMGGMGGSCIATVTAFAVVNAQRFGLGPYDVVVWVAPGLLGGIGLRAWQAYYRRRFAPIVAAPRVSVLAR